MERTNLFVILLIFTLNITIVLPADDKCKKIPENELPPPSTESQIKEHILCDYDKTVRPVLDNNATKVTFVLVAEKIVFNEHSSSSTMDTTIILQWTDQHLSWDPNDFEGTKKIHLSTEEIWVPDLSIYNSSPYGSKEVITTTPCLVYFTKKVICVFQTSLKGICTPDFRHWPYDVQNCTIKIGSWYHAGSELDYNFVSAKKDMTLYEENSQWILKELTMKVDPGIYKKFPNETFPSVKLQFLISRRTADKFISVMVPFFVLISLTLLTLLLDPRSSDRIYISVLSIPCHIMYLLQYSWEVPESGNLIPYIVLYLRNSNVLSSIALVETMVVRYLLGKTNESPVWLVSITTRIVDNKVGKLLLYRELNINDLDDETAASDESGTMVEIKGKPSEWYLLGRIIDSLLFIIVILLYFISFLICIT